MGYDIRYQLQAFFIKLNNGELSLVTFSEWLTRLSCDKPSKKLTKSVWVRKRCHFSHFWHNLARRILFWRWGCLMFQFKDLQVEIWCFQSAGAIIAPSDTNWHTKSRTNHTQILISHLSDEFKLGIIRNLSVSKPNTVHEINFRKTSCMKFTIKYQAIFIH